MKGDRNMKRQYDKPTRIRWFEPNVKCWLGGIAYKDEIICGCHGDILKLDGFEEDEVVELGEWINIEKEIRGGKI